MEWRCPGATVSKGADERMHKGGGWDRKETVGCGRVLVSGRHSVGVAAKRWRGDFGSETDILKPEKRKQIKKYFKNSNSF